ncbi:hypothetical protein HDEF_1292 [Candidatus Hamiltonella defensa 5AT (Acyrthosiphon pisum)]|uniref:Uncharacterized protein n=1 Tax=Hamiltonella defensa subsp. Acyrthosiphon pisum (strain 5AT) TaxID=572265 RepID=C4K5V1_HAMD5|nr:hypothetical protein HDEF_1292 [Candidatus Hamiltonella defensa 5AT (Acyrthosiphon pisum)]
MFFKKFLFKILPILDYAMIIIMDYKIHLYD